jgi:lipopolysaccharide biosynthesis protein
LKLQSVCHTVHERRNAGYDFAAWRDVLLNENMQEWDEVLLTNSSIVGPLFSLSAVFDEMEGRSCDFWGLTRSRFVRPHIQSYFMCFRKRLIRSRAWSDFWNSVRDESRKWDVIAKYETRLMEVFETHGFSGDSYLPQMSKTGIERIFLRRMNTRLPVYVPIDKNRTNPTIHSPLELIESGLPYLKASLLWGHNRRQAFPLEKIMALKNVDYDWSLLGLDHRR